MMLLLSLLLSLAQSTPAADPFLQRLAGRWAGSGTVLNTAASVQLRWEWALDARFLRLTFENQMGLRRFEGHAYYRALGDGRYRGTWFDNSGMIRPIDAKLEGDALVAAWGSSETERGETTYRLLADGAMEITDRVLGKDGQWRPFGLVRVTRAP